MGKLMKKFWRSDFAFYAVVTLVVVLAATIYFNIGYWGGKSCLGAMQKMADGKELNGFQKFQMSVHWQDAITDDKGKIDKDAFMVGSVVFWPIGLLASIVVVLFKFIFLGGFFRIIASIF